MASDKASERQMFRSDRQQMEGRMLGLVQRECQEPVWETEGHKGVSFP